MIFSWTRISALGTRAKMAWRMDFKEIFESTWATPIPCVPLVILMIRGKLPPTAWILSSSLFIEELVTTAVFGVGTPAAFSFLYVMNLSSQLSMASRVFNTKNPSFCSSVRKSLDSMFFKTVRRGTMMVLVGLKV